MSNKPKIAVETGLLTREEAAEFMGMGMQSFNLIAKELTGIRLGSQKYYSISQLKAYVTKMTTGPQSANIQQPDMISA